MVQNETLRTSLKFFPGYIGFSLSLVVRPGLPSLGQRLLFLPRALLCAWTSVHGYRVYSIFLSDDTPWFTSSCSKCTLSPAVSVLI